MDPATAAAIGQAASSVIGTGLNAIGVGSKQNNPPPISSYSDAAFGTIRGKVEAAEKYGISKLYALGAPVSSPVMGVGGGPSLGDSIASMGQDVSRAVAAGQSDAERSLQALTLEKAGLENDYLREQIASVRLRTARESGPPLPVTNSGNGNFKESITPPTRTPGMNFGVPIPFAPDVSDAQTWENRYGDSEILSMLYGGGILAADIRHNIQRGLTSDNPAEQSAARKIWDYLTK